MNYIEWANRYLCKHWINADDMLSTIVDAIKNDKPLSYTRYGDGELILLKEYFSLIKEKPEHITLCDADLLIDPVSWIAEPYNVLSFYSKKWHTSTIFDFYKSRWSVNKLSDMIKIVKIIGEDLIFSLQYSSHIGIYDQSDMVLDSTIDDFYLHKHSYVPHIQLFTDCGVDFKKLTDVNTYRKKALANLDEFKKILDGKPIHIFTSNEEELKNITKLHKMLETSITYTNLTPIKGDWRTHSFAHLDFLKDKCKSINEQIILFGLGAGSKQIPSHLSTMYGKTVIDIGSILDAWANKKTRSYMESIDWQI